MIFYSAGNHIDYLPYKIICIKISIFQLFEFNRSRRLRRTIIAYPVHILHLCQNPVSNLLQHFPIHLLHAGGHRINRIDCPDNHHIFKASRMVLHSDRLEVRHYGKVLPYRLIQSGLFEFLTQNRIRFPYGFQPVACDRAKAAHAKSGAGERLTVYHSRRQSQFDTAGSYFILKQLL